MFDGRAKCFTESVQFSTEVLNIQQRLTNFPLRCPKFHGECQMIHGSAKWSMERVKYSTEVLNVPRRLSNDPQRC